MRTAGVVLLAMLVGVVALAVGRENGVAVAGDRQLDYCANVPASALRDLGRELTRGAKLRFAAAAKGKGSAGGWFVSSDVQAPKLAGRVDLGTWAVKQLFNGHTRFYAVNELARRVSRLPRGQSARPPFTDSDPGASRSRYCTEARTAGRLRGD